MLTIEYLAELVHQHEPAASARVREFSVSGRNFAFNTRPSIMGVVNLSSDSWYRESVCLSTERAIQRSRVLIAQGAEVVDIGAESTLANAARRNAEQQNGQLLPIVKALCAEHIPVSVETYEPAVAQASLEAGASILNFSGTDQSEAIFQQVASHNAAVILCYVQGAHVRAVGDFDFGADPIGLMYEFFARQAEKAERLGVSKIIIDPGLGFYYRNLQDSALRVRYQMQIFLSAFRLRALGFPVCQALPHAFEYFGEEVRCAEPFFAVLAALGKTDLFRTHEVPRIKAVLETLAAF
jgi:dihydropteroate synthase